MAIPELTHKQRVESFMDDRLSSRFFETETLTFTQEELAEFCLKEIDDAIEFMKNTDVEDVEEQLQD